MDLLLAANFDDVVSVIITLAILGFSVLSQVMSGNNAKKKKAEQRRQQQARQAQPPAGQPPGRPAAQGPPAANKPASIEAEIEEFLRQARGDAPRQPPPPPPPAPTPPTPPPLQRPAPRPVEVTPLQPGDGYGEELTDHVARHIGQDSISQRDVGLGDYLEDADERFEQHLETVFDHDVGHLAHVEHVDDDISEGTDASAWTKTRDDKSKTAAEIAAMLKSPDTVRKMFIVTEVFKRPEI